VAVADPDQDGVAGAADCRPFDPNAHPGATEACNGRDDDCDGLTDEAWAEASATCRSMGYRLASIDDADEQAWLLARATADLGPGACRHGLNDRAVEGQWIADNGSTSPFSAWYGSGPDNAGYGKD